MNRFHVIKCVGVDEADYKGPCVIMACTSDPSFMLFFPVNKENSKVINYVLKDNSYDINTSILGIYKTMIDSWGSGDRYLSGVIMDAIFDEEAKDEVLMIRLVLSDSDGKIDSMVRVNFLHAVLLAAMENVDIIVGDSLLEKMAPDDDDENEKKIRKHVHPFPEDKKIVDIAKKIMGGKIKDNE